MSDFNEYQNEIRKFMNPETLADKSRVLLNGAMGACGEAGEIMDLLKKWMFHGHDIDVDKLRKEIGDLQFYVSQMADGIDTPLQEIAVGNVTKLSKRYPDGFNVEDSKAKKDELGQA